MFPGPFSGTHSDYSSVLLTGLPSCTIKHLKMIQNESYFRSTNRDTSYHGLPVAVCITFKALTLACRVVSSTAASYMSNLIQVYSLSLTPTSLWQQWQTIIAWPTSPGSVREMENSCLTFHDIHTDLITTLNWKDKNLLPRHSTNNLMHQQAGIFWNIKPVSSNTNRPPMHSDYRLQFFSITWAEIPKRTYALRQTGA